MNKKISKRYRDSIIRDYEIDKAIDSYNYDNEVLCVNKLITKHSGLIVKDSIYSHKVVLKILKNIQRRTPAGVC